MLVSKSAGTILLSVDDAVDNDDVDGTTCSVISFIILYGLVPRNDLGKYCASMEDDSYSVGEVDAAAACAAEAEAEAEAEAAVSA